MIKEYFTFTNTQTMFRIENNKIDSQKNVNTISKSVRVFDPNTKTVGLAPARGNTPDEILEQKATDLLSLKIPYNYDLEKDTKAVFTKEKLNITSSMFLESFTDSILNDLKDLTKHFVISGNTTIEQTKKTIKNTLGLDLALNRSYIGCHIALKQKESGNISDAANGFRKFEINNKNYIQFIKNTQFIANACLSNIIPLETKNYKVLFNNILYKLYSDIIGHTYEEGTSVLTGKLNQKITNENINIYESYDDEKETTFIPFDDEGVIRNENLYIIKNGVLTNILYDKTRASKYNKKTTGNGFRSYNSNTNISCRTLEFDKVDVKASDLISEDIVIVPLLANGGDFLPNGNFSLPVQFALVYKNGVFVGKAPQITLTGNYLNCMNDNFIALGTNDILPETLESTLVLSDIRVNVN